MADPGSERGSQEARPSSWTARILAPLALVIVAAAVVLVVTGSLDGSDGKRKGDGERTVSAEGCSPEAEAAVENGYFVIEPGEDLSVVADRTCVPIEELIELNPNLDPQLIQVGSCVDLVVDGCKVLAAG